MINIVEDKKGIVLFVKSAKKVSYHEMYSGLEFLEKNDKLPRDLRIVEDATGSEAGFTNEEIDRLIDKIHRVAGLYRSIKHAVIHDDPVNTAFAFMVNNKNKSNNYNIKVFSSKEGAIKWVDYNPL